MTTYQEDDGVTTTAPTPLYDLIATELGEPDFTPAPDYEVTLAQAVLAMAAAP